MEQNKKTNISASQSSQRKLEVTHLCAVLASVAAIIKHAHGQVLASGGYSLNFDWWAPPICFSFKSIRSHGFNAGLITIQRLRPKELLANDRMSAPASQANRSSRQGLAKDAVFLIQDGEAESKQGTSTSATRAAAVCRMGDLFPVPVRWLLRLAWLAVFGLAGYLAWDIRMCLSPLPPSRLLTHFGCVASPPASCDSLHGGGNGFGGARRAQRRPYGQRPPPVLQIPHFTTRFPRFVLVPLFFLVGHMPVTDNCPRTNDCRRNPGVWAGDPRV